MVQACSNHGVQLTFNHQRRFGALSAGPSNCCSRAPSASWSGWRRVAPTFMTGALTGSICFSTITTRPRRVGHWPVGRPWGSRIFGVPVEGQGISYFRYRNGVYGLMVTGFEAGWQASNRLVGTDGVIEVGAGANVPLRIWGKDQGAWQTVDAGRDYTAVIMSNEPFWT